MNVSGKLIRKFDTVHVTSTFSKREFVVETEEGQYPQQIIMQFTKDKCALLDDIAIDQVVNVELNLRGRSWTSPQGEEKWFNTLEAWRITVVTDSPNSAMKPNENFNNTPPSGPVAQAPADGADDSLPF
jgi:hypothetical protein